MTGFNAEVQYYGYALDLIIDTFDLDCDDDMREQIEKSARHLYGLAHARYIQSTRGLAKMVCSFFMHNFSMHRSLLLDESNTDFFPFPAREVQKGRLREMPSGQLRRAVPASDWHVGRAQLAVRQALLRSVRGHL